MCNMCKKYYERFEPIYYLIVLPKVRIKETLDSQIGRLGPFGCVLITSLIEKEEKNKNEYSADFLIKHNNT